MSHESLHARLEDLSPLQAAHDVNKNPEGLMLIIFEIVSAIRPPVFASRELQYPGSDEVHALDVADLAVKVRVGVEDVVEGLGGFALGVSKIHVVRVRAVEVFVDVVAYARCVEALVMVVELEGAVNGLQLLLKLGEVAFCAKATMLFVVRVVWVLVELLAPRIPYRLLMASVIAGIVPRLVSPDSLLLVLLK